MISRRREERTNVSVAIRMWGMDANGKPFSVAATTYDLTRYGARIMGVRVPLAPGEIVGVQHGSEKARFRVAWYGRPGSRLEGNVGLQALDWKKYIWGALVPDSAPELVDNQYQPLAAKTAPGLPDTDPLLEGGRSEAGFHRAPTPPPPSPGALERLAAAERRLANRYETSAPVTLTDPQIGDTFDTSLREMSLGGCFIQTPRPFPPRTPIQMVLRPFGMEIAVAGQVRHIEPGVGFGVKFTQMSEASRQKVQTAIDRLANESTALVIPDAPSTTNQSQQISSALERLRRQLSELESLAAKQAVDPGLMRSLQSQTEQARQAGLAIQQWVEFQERRQNPASLLAEIENRRLRTSTALLRDLLAQTDAANFTIENPAVAELYAAAIAVYRRLAWLADRRKSPTADPAPKQT